MLAVVIDTFTPESTTTVSQENVNLIDPEESPACPKHQHLFATVCHWHNAQRVLRVKRVTMSFKFLCRLHPEQPNLSLCYTRNINFASHDLLSSLEKTPMMLTCLRGTKAPLRLHNLVGVLLAPIYTKLRKNLFRNKRDKGVCRNELPRNMVHISEHTPSIPTCASPAKILQHVLYLPAPKSTPAS